MRIVSSNTDLAFNIQLLNQKDHKVGLELFNSFNIKLFTTDKYECLIYTKEDIQEGVLRVPSSDLRTLCSGQIKVQASYSIGDSKYDDGNFDDNGTKTTDLYLKND